MRYDYAAAGFYTFDCLGWPVADVPPGGGTNFIREITLAVSGAAGTAAIAAAKLGLKTLAIGGYGQDMTGDWAVARLAEFGIDTSGLQRMAGVPSSSSIVLTRADGSRPALHVKGATGHFTVPPADFDRVTDARIFHLGGVGLMDAMDGAPNAALMRHAKARGCITTVDVFAGSREDMADVAAVLPWTDYFIPSVEEARALTGLTDLDAMAQAFLDLGAGACVFTLGAEGAYYCDRQALCFTIPAFAIDVVCTCGCGDVFNAGFATGLLHGMTPQDCVRLAQACSALNATGLGSQAGIVSLPDTLTFMKNCTVKAA
ncbi:MAG: kinase [Rhodobacteraceae bacterium GWE1_64_9]|nr:MAG: kinase [Rhodobacteraceae bacterium GWE1_64_9]OHC49160.1 MAG: kinase [Rhodobacteraceae bacterium GWF1_65_7]HBD90772.1 kinase [Gemmobacter sp.]